MRNRLNNFPRRGTLSNIFRGGSDGLTFEANFTNGLVDDRFVLTRSETTSSNATVIGPDGYLKFVAANEWRFHHNPLTKEIRGLLVEPHSTNYAGDFAAGSNMSIDSASSAIIVPDGYPANISGKTATKANTASDGVVLFRAVKGEVGNGATWAASVFVKYGSSTTNTMDVVLEYENSTDFGGAVPQATWTLTPTSCTYVGQTGCVSNATGEVETYQNGWHRIHLTFHQTQNQNVVTLGGTSFDTYTRNNHGLTNGTRVRISAQTAVPGGYNTNQTLYVVNATTDTFQVSNAVGGAVRTATSAGSGTLWVNTNPSTNPNFKVRIVGPANCSLHVWGQQFEAMLTNVATTGAINQNYYTRPTSWIPNRSNADGTNPQRLGEQVQIRQQHFTFHNQNEGTYWLELGNVVRGATNAYSLLLTNGNTGQTSSRMMFITYGFSGNQLWYKTALESGTWTDSNAAISIDPQRTPPGSGLTTATEQSVRLCCGYSSGAYPFAVNGGVVSGIRGSAITPPPITAMYLCYAAGAHSHGNYAGCIRKLKYWPSKLSDATIRYMTTSDFNPDQIVLTTRSAKNSERYPLVRAYSYANSNVGRPPDGATINCDFVSELDENILPSIMTFARGSGGMYTNTHGNLVGYDFSSTSNTIGTGTKTFTLAATAEVDRLYAIGNRVLINNTTNSMTGTVTAYDPVTQTLVVNVTSSSGSGTFTSWSIGRNELRWDWNAAGTELQGVLIEGERTNYLNWSESFATSGGTNNNWTRTNITLFTGDNPSPDGSDNAIAFAASASNATIIASSSVSGGGSQARTFSVWLRRNSGSGNVQLTMDNGTNWFTQSVTSTWQRFAITVEQISHQPGIRIATANDRVEIWGAQLEDGDHATSYIPNLGWRNTRSADQLQVNFSYGGVNPYSPNYGTILSSIGTRGNLDGYGFSFVYSDDSYVYEGEGLGFNSLVETNYEFGNGTYFDSSLPQSIVSSYNTVAEIYQTSVNDTQGSLYSTEVLTSPGAFPDGNLLTNIWVGSFDATTGHIDGHVKKFVYWPFELSTESIESINGYVPPQD